MTHTDTHHTQFDGAQVTCLERGCKFTQDATPADVLALEIERTHRALDGAIETRANHPDFGIGESALWGLYYRLEGMVQAHWMITEPNTYAAPALAATKFDINFRALASQIRG